MGQLHFEQIGDFCVHNVYQCKEIKSPGDSMSPLNTNRMSGNNFYSMTLIRVDDVYNVSPLS